MSKYGWHGDPDHSGFDPDIASVEARFKGRKPVGPPNEQVSKSGEVREKSVPNSFQCEAFLGFVTPLQVCKSGAGYYLGVVTTEEMCDGRLDNALPGEPLCRDSQEYWGTKQEAIDALASGNWIQRPTP